MSAENGSAFCHTLSESTPSSVIGSTVRIARIVAGSGAAAGATAAGTTTAAVAATETDSAAGAAGVTPSRAAIARSEAIEIMTGPRRTRGGWPSRSSEPPGPRRECAGDALGIARQGSHRLHQLEPGLEPQA